MVVCSGHGSPLSPLRSQVWKSVRACATQSLTLKFGCDPKATLAYVDIVDHDRSLLDWCAARARGTIHAPERPQGLVYSSIPPPRSDFCQDSVVCSEFGRGLMSEMKCVRQCAALLGSNLQ